ncbi:MAG TPA: shikimate kinase [Acidobacteriaceae bacterium]
MATKLPDLRGQRNLSAKAVLPHLKSSKRLLEVAVQPTSQSRTGQIPSPKRIVLTGFMGAGKSTIGPRLAHRLGWSFIDLDDEIIRIEQRSIAEIFDAIGEGRFRELERNALADTLQQEHIVLALGGGAIETEANRQSIQEDNATLLLYLAAPLEVLIERCELQQLHRKAVRRPILERRAELTERFQRRRPLYEQADWTIDTTGKTLDELVHIIMTQWNKASWKLAQEQPKKA